jgi:predicted amidohydrolase YtcJ
LTGSLLTLLATAALAAAPSAADLILEGGHIRTPDGWAEAVAVQSGVIVAVGDAAHVHSLKGPHTQIVELHGATVIPGLHDVHVHPVFAGVSERQCKVDQGKNMAAFQAAVKNCAIKTAKGAWIRGGQWDAPALGEPLNLERLDAVTGDHPAYFEDSSGHSVWVNSAALRLAGVEEKTPNPPGGVIEHDEHGHLTGVLREDAGLELLRGKIPKPDAATLRSALQWAHDEMLSHGLTSYTEASVGFTADFASEMNNYQALAASKVVMPRATLCLTWGPDSADFERTLVERNLYRSEFVHPDCVKIFLDGVPTESHTAAMLDPYADTVAGRDDEASRRGILFAKQDVLNAAVTRFDAQGLTVKFHAAGDAAVRAGLDAIAAARSRNGFGGLMHNVGHCTFVSSEDIQRARGIGATFEVSPYLFGPSPINDAITAAIGPSRIERVWPVREMLDAGALVVPGSDWSVVPSVNPCGRHRTTRHAAATRR